MKVPKELTRIINEVSTVNSDRTTRGRVPELRFKCRKQTDSHYEVFYWNKKTPTHHRLRLGEFE